MRTGKAFRSAVLVVPVFLLLVSAAPAPAPMSPHEKAAREVVKLIGGEDLATQGILTMMEMYITDLELAPYEAQIRGWYQTVIAESDLQEQMAKLYMDTFSEKELQEIAAFYKTPAGRKAIETVPKLMKLGAEVGRRQAEAHGAELAEILEKAREERENQPASTDAEAQKRTVSQIRDVGTAMFSWLTDQVGAAAAGQSQTEHVAPSTDLKDYAPISHEELTMILVPQYIQKVPETDGWGNRYEFFLNAKDPMAQQVMSIRSPGRDGKFSAKSYTVTAFDPDDLDEDIVWADGFFVRWPQRPEPREE
jgi:uncharacterized protein